MGKLKTLLFLLVIVATLTYIPMSITPFRMVNDIITKESLIGELKSRIRILPAYVPMLCVYIFIWFAPKV